MKEYNDILTNVPNNRSRFFISAKSPITNCQFFVPLKEDATEAYAQYQKEKLIRKLEEMDANYVFKNPMEPLLA
jgi:hypothetical protein